MTTELSNEAKWQRDTLEKLVLTAFQEQRRQRRWNIFFKLVFLSIFLGLIGILWFKPFRMFGRANHSQHIGIIDIRGTISASSPTNADNIIISLQNAFRNSHTAAIVLRINSPGGSAVQAGQIYDEIQYQRRKNPNKSIFTVCEDVCASAAYYIASATDQIYANPASIVGSIGVRMDGFGFVESLKKLGIERRVLVSGQHKLLLDPFQPLQPEAQQIAQDMLSDVHQQFIEAVKIGRGKRLKDENEKEKQLFSGLAWTGKQALPLGLIDGLSNLDQLTREVIKLRTFVNYTRRPSPLQKLMEMFSASLMQQINALLSPTLQSHAR